MREGDITEAFAVSIFEVGGNADRHDRSMRSEFSSDGVLICVEGEVANEQSVGWLTDLIGVLLTTVVLAFVVAWTGIGEVDIQRTIVQVSTGQRLVCFCSISRILEINVAVSVTC